MNEQIRTALAGLQRVNLLPLPTPLEESPRLSAALRGPRILIKRDDLTGLATGGSKARRLEYILGDAVAKGADVLLLAARIQSNHARQLASAAAKLGLSVHLLLTMQRTDVLQVQGNILLEDLFGAKISLLAPEHFAKRDEILLEMSERLRQQGRTPYVVNSAWPKLLGAAGHAAGAVELYDQLRAMGISANHIWMASAGDTAVGHLVAGKALAAGWKVSAQAYDPAPLEVERERRREKMAESANELSNLLGLELGFSAQEVDFLTESVGETFVHITPASAEAVRLVAQAEGILLDPFHTGRAMASLLAQIHQGRIGHDDTVVFLHTGGIPNLFASGGALASKQWAYWSPEASGGE